MDLVEEGLTTDLVFRSARPEVLDETDDCWDCELVARALDDRRGEGGAMSESGHRGGERKREGDVRRTRTRPKVRWANIGACNTAERKDV